MRRRQFCISAKGGAALITVWAARVSIEVPSYPNHCYLWTSQNRLLASFDLRDFTVQEWIAGEPDGHLETPRELAESEQVA